MNFPNKNDPGEEVYRRVDTPLSGDERENDEVFEDAISPLDTIRYAYDGIGTDFADVDSPPVSSKSEDAGRGSRDSRGSKGMSDGSFPSFSSPCASPMTDISYHSHSPSTEASDAKFAFQDNSNISKSGKSTLDEALKSEKDFMEFVMSLPAPRPPPDIPESSKILKSMSTGSVVKSSGSTKVGLDHLDNLCRLMQQLGELREANAKLQKKVQYLEVIRSLHDMHAMDIGPTPDTRPSPSGHSPLTTKGFQPRPYPPDPGVSAVSEKRTGERSSPHLKERRYTVYKSKTQVNINQGQVRTRERSKSVGHEEFADGKSKKKFPKWTKVKEALGLERSGQMERHPNFEEFYAAKRETASRGSKKSLRSAGYIRNDHAEKYQSLYGSTHYSTKDTVPAISVQGPSSGRSSQRSSMLTTEEIMGTMEDSYGIRSGSLKRRSIPSRDSRLDTAYKEQQRRRRSTPSPTSGVRECSSAKEDLGKEDARAERHQTVERDTDVDSDMSKYDKDDLKKSHKSPWGRVKTLIQTRKESLRRKQRKGDSSLKRDRTDLETGTGTPISAEVSAAGDDVESEPLDSTIADQLDEPLFKKEQEIQEQTSEETQKNPEVTTTIEPKETNRSVKRQDVPSKPKEPGKTDSLEKQIRKHKPLDASLSDPVDVCPSRDQETRQSDKKAKPKPLNLSSPTQDDVPFLAVHPSGTNESPRTPSPSPPLHRKSRWNRVKKVFGSKRDGVPQSQSVPASPNTAADGNFDYDLVLVDEDTSEEKVEECQKEPSASINIPKPSKEQHTENEQTAVSGSAPVADLVEELQRNLSEDFSKKIREWEKMRSGTGNSGFGNNYGSVIGKTSPSLERKGSDSKVKKNKQEKSKADREKANKQRMKDLNWLDKELQKVEREKQRLAKEKQKFEERAVRLERLRETVMNAQTTNKKEVLVRTSAGEFRFEGISDAFTKKLYEWETKRGVGPELSTIALLDASLQGKAGHHPNSMEKNAPIQRGLSKSESSLVELNQPSQTSSASLPSLKHDAALQTDLPQPSRSNSVPELPSFCAPKEKLLQPRSQSNASMGKTSESYAPPEVTQLIDSDSEEPSTEGKRPDGEQIEHRDALQSEDNYYTLLEENMFLLEQLKRKEEICRRLEEELETLDDRVEDMNKRHQQEMERYREKLWEVHKLENKPRALQGSIRLITELKERIQELERCSERLKADKETLEDSFRYHSEQQAKLTVDLIEKMKELQQITIAGASSKEVEGRSRRRRRNFMRCDAENVVRLHDLSTQLLQQARELEHALVERTRQVCRLRWELLHREVSAMRLQTELHRARVQGGAIQPCTGASAVARRIKYGKQRSWSSSDRLTLSQPLEESNSEDRVQDQLKRISAAACNNWPKIEYDASELTTTVQELKMELLKLCAAAEQPTESEEGASEAEAYTSHQESSDCGRCKMPSPLPISMQDNYESFVGREAGTTGNHSITVRRNSADNVSSLSGPEGSESSSLNDGERMAFALRLPRHRWRRSRDNISTSSESSFIEEETFTSVPWCRPRTSSDFGSEEKEIAISPDDANTRELILKYSLCHDSRRGIHGRNSDPGFMASSSRSSSEMTDQHRDSWSEVYHRRLLRGEQTSETSSSAVNVPWDESSSSGERVTRYRYQDSTERDEKGLPSIKEVTNGSGVSVNKCSDAGEKECAGSHEDIAWQEWEASDKRTEQAIDLTSSQANEDGISGYNKERTEAGLSSADSKEFESLSCIIDDKQSSETSTIVGQFTSENSMLALPEDPGNKDHSSMSETKEESYNLSTEELHPLRRTSLFQFQHLATEYRNPFEREYEHGRKQRSFSVPEVRIDIARVSGENKIPEDQLHPKPLFSTLSQLQTEKNRSKAADKQNNRDAKEVKAMNIPECSTSKITPTNSVTEQQSQKSDVSEEQASSTTTKKVASVKPLIERYNQRFGENQLGEAILPDIKESFIKLSIPSTAKPLDSDSSSPLQQSPVSTEGQAVLTTPPITFPPPSPSLQARAEALRKAKEEFIRKTGGIEFTPLLVSTWESNKSDVPKPKGFTLPRISALSTSKPAEIQENLTGSKQSCTSTSDSQETKDDAINTARMCGSVESMPKSHDLPYQPAPYSSTNIKGSKSNPALATLSTSITTSTSQTSTRSSKTTSTFLNLKLKKGKKKKEMPTVSALCKQSLFLNIDDAKEHVAGTAEGTEKSASSPQSCSSPEDKSKPKTKSSWLNVNLFKPK